MDRIKYLQNFGSKLDECFYKELSTGTKYNTPLLDENGDKVKTILVVSKLINTPIDEFEKENIRIELHLRDNNKLLLIKRIPTFRKASQITKTNKILSEDYKFEEDTEFANLTIEYIIKALKHNMHYAKKTYMINNIPKEIKEIDKQIHELNKRRSELYLKFKENVDKNMKIEF